MSLRSLKSLIVIVIVDNEVGDNSSPCSCMTPVKGLCRKSNVFDPRICTYTQESILALEHHVDVLPIGNMCQGAHGLSLLLIAEYVDDDDHVNTTASAREETSTASPWTHHKYLLFDTGPNPELWKNNAQRLHIPLHKIETIVLSHYHIDHSGGLRSVVPEVVRAKDEFDGQQGDDDEAGSVLVVDLHSDYIASRGVKIRGKIYPMVPDNPSPIELQSLVDDENKIQISKSKSAHVIGNGCFYVSGEIPRVTPFETGLPGHFRRLNDGNWIPDPDILDERYVACHLEGRGIVIFSACSHAGIVNVCKDAMDKLNCTTIAGIVGGLHLGGASVEERVDETITALKVMQPGLILAGHCTGWRAKAILAAVFNTNYQPLCTGGFYHFKSLPSTN